MTDIDEPALQRPIGWWLKEADGRLDAAFDRSLDGGGVNRRGWQVLSSLARQPMSRTELTASLASFDSAATVEQLVDDFAARNLIEDSGEELLLTAEGERKRAALAPLVEDVRRQVTAALPEDDYVQLIRLLERLVNSLR